MDGRSDIDTKEMVKAKKQKRPDLELLNLPLELLSMILKWVRKNLVPLRTVCKTFMNVLDDCLLQRYLDFVTPSDEYTQLRINSSGLKLSEVSKFCCFIECNIEIKAFEDMRAFTSLKILYLVGNNLEVRTNLSLLPVSLTEMGLYGMSKKKISGDGNHLTNMRSLSVHSKELVHLIHSKQLTRLQMAEHLRMELSPLDFPKLRVLMCCGTPSLLPTLELLEVNTVDLSLKFPPSLTSLTIHQLNKTKGNQLEFPKTIKSLNLAYSVIMSPHPWNYVFPTDLVELGFDLPAPTNFISHLTKLKKLTLNNFRKDEVLIPPLVEDFTIVFLGCSHLRIAPDQINLPSIPRSVKVLRLKSRWDSMIDLSSVPTTLQKLVLDGKQESFFSIPDNIRKIKIKGAFI